MGPPSAMTGLPTVLSVQTMQAGTGHQHVVPSASASRRPDWNGWPAGLSGLAD
jgi:hypothetical protein